MSTPPLAADGIDLKVMRDALTRSSLITAAVDDRLVVMLGPKVMHLALERIAQAVADEYLRMHLQDVLAAIDAQAVANLAVADAAAGIRATVDVGVRKIHDDMGALINEAGREREVLVPGWFGVKRGVVR